MTTTVIIKNANNDTVMETFTTEVENPVLALDYYEDGGESSAIFLGGEMVYNTAVGGFMLTVAQDGTYNKDTDVGISGSKTLTTGETYTFYQNFDVYCPSCGSTIVHCPECGATGCYNCDFVAYGPWCSPECYEAGFWTCSCGNENLPENTYCELCGEPKPADTPDTSAPFTVMPTEDWLTALDGLRGLTHSSAPIKSGDLASIFAGISVLDVGDRFVAINTGTITPAADTNDLNRMRIEHGLGQAPNFFLLFSSELSIPTSSNYKNLNFMVAAYMNEGTAMRGIMGSGVGYSSITAVNFFHIQSDGSTYQGSDYVYISDFFTDTSVGAPLSFGQLRAGKTYHWIAGVMNQK